MTMTDRAVAVSLLMIAWSAAPAAADTAAYERAWFRTLTLLNATAPKATVAAATQCIAAATKGFPDTFKQTVIEVDRRPLYLGSERLRAMAASVSGLDTKTVAPLNACFDRLADGAFGATTGAIPATSAPNPDDVAACPISVEGFGGDELTCYCRPMLGGVAYGDKTYADISAICHAYRHAGGADYLTGGVLRAVFRPGCAAYEGVEANGALSAETGRSARSFHFPSVGEGKCPP